jgi:hypothetical protein
VKFALQPCISRIFTYIRNRKSANRFMRKLFILILASVAFTAVVRAQDTSFDKKVLEDLKPGMAEAQVKQIVGEPILFDRIEEDREALLKYIQQRAFKKEKEGLVIVNNGKK